MNQIFFNASAKRKLFIASSFDLGFFGVLSPEYPGEDSFELACLYVTIFITRFSTNINSSVVLSLRDRLSGH